MSRLLLVHFVANKGSSDRNGSTSNAGFLSNLSTKSSQKGWPIIDWWQARACSCTHCVCVRACIVLCVSLSGAACRRSFSHALASNPHGTLFESHVTPEHHAFGMSKRRAKSKVVYRDGRLVIRTQAEGRGTPTLEPAPHTHTNAIRS